MTAWISKNAEHRVVYRKHFGKIPNGYHVHHINCDSKDHRPSNLIAIPPKLHEMIHQEMRDRRRIMDREEIEKRLKVYSVKLTLPKKVKTDFDRLVELFI